MCGGKALRHSEFLQQLNWRDGLDSTHFSTSANKPSHHPITSQQHWLVSPSFNCWSNYTTMFARRISQSILRQTSARFTFSAQSVNINYMTRCFGAAARKTSFEPSTEVENEDMIRDYIKGLMDKQQDDQDALKPISDEDLQQRLDHFQVCIM